MQVGILELVNAAKHAGGPGAHKKAVEIGQQMRQEMGGQGNLKRGEQGKEFKNRLEAAGLLPKKPEKPGVSPEKKAEASAPPSNLKKELAVLAAKDPQVENPKAPSVAKPDSQFGAMATGRLENQLAFMKIAGQKDLADRMEKEIEKRKAVEKKIPSTASSNTVYAKQEAADFDKSFKPDKHQGGTYDWNETSKSGTKKIGEGGFGAVLLTKGPPPIAVKRGRVSTTEAEIIDKVGKADLGPRLIAGETAKGGRTEYGVLLKEGRIALSVVPGKELMGMKSDTKVGNTTAGDAYWKARADLHRLGIAHNDSHPGNLLIDKDGKGRWVDMGLAHDHPGAALAEALGVLRKPSRAIGVGQGDWQGSGWERQTGMSNTGAIGPWTPKNLQRMQENHNTKVLPFLQSKGLTTDEIGTVMTYGIRQDPSSYTTTSGFNKLNDSDALQAINLLYDGI
jgi:hypothetical protein